MNDHEIVEALRDRSVKGLHGLYDAYAEPLYAYCWCLLGDEPTTRDALRDTVIVAEAHIDKLADPSRLRVWLYAIARGECLWRRGDKAQAPVEVAPAAPAGSGAGSGRSVSLDELLSGGRPAADDATTRLPTAAVAPGVLGAPGGDGPGGVTGAAGGGGGTDAGDTLPQRVASQEEAGGSRTGYADDVEKPAVAVKVLGAVPPTEREALELNARHGFEIADVARIIGVAVQQIQAMLANADQVVRSGLAVERLASGGRLGAPELAARLDGGQRPAEAVVLAVQPPALPGDLRSRVIGIFTAAEQVSYRLHVARRAGSFDKAGFPVSSHAADGGAAGGTSGRAWRWPVGIGVAACLAAGLSLLLMWPNLDTEDATTAAVPGEGPHIPAPAPTVSTSAGHTAASPRPDVTASPDGAVGGGTDGRRLGTGGSGDGSAAGTDGSAGGAGGGGGSGGTGGGSGSGGDDGSGSGGGQQPPPEPSKEPTPTPTSTGTWSPDPDPPSPS